MGVVATAAHTLTVTVPFVDTYASQYEPSPGYVTGDADTAIAVVELVTDTVPDVHAPATSKPPPMLPVVPLDTVEIVPLPG